MNLTMAEQRSLLDELLSNGVHYLLHDGHLRQRYVSVPFGQKETAPGTTNTGSGEADPQANQLHGDCITDERNCQL